MMRRKILTGAVLAALVLNSCEFVSYEEYSIPPYDGSLTFTEVNKKADWKNRLDHASVVFNDRIWVLGGYNPGEVWGDTYYEDVWSSVDGVEWELVNDNAPWKGRRGHSVVAFDDGSGEALYLTGGFSVDEATGYRQYCNDVWRSVDGVNWEQIKERSYPKLEEPDTWFPRMNHRTVVANHGGQDYMFIIGGRTQLEGHNGGFAQEYFNDVWRSVDGISWDSLNNNDYGIRASHAAAVDPSSGMIYLQGGMHGVIFEADSNYYKPLPNWHWLWSSPDGVNWTASYDSIVDPGYMERSEHEMVYYDNTLWVFPGATTSTMHYQFGNPNHYPIWRVNDGGLWSVDSKGSDLRGRHSYGAAIKDEKIWILGGFTSNMGQENDVWTAEMN
jgi:hypothetical protein